MPTPQVRLLLVDDHRVVRLGLAALFRTVPHFQVAGEAGTAAEALVEAQRCLPHVVLMDVRLPDGSGIEACREIRSALPDTRVVMLTSYSDEQAVVAAILAGAAGYLLKQTDPERLVGAVETVARGESLLDPAVTRIVFERLRQMGEVVVNDVFTGLTEQERRILPLSAVGRTNKEIAGALILSEHTVKDYVSSILQKLHLTRRAEAAAFVARHQTPTG